MTLEIAAHKSILLYLLKDIYSDAEIGPALGFKGGTAAYLFYGLNRFSVDLDFDLLNSDKEDIIIEKLKNILNEYGEIKEARKKRYSLFFLLSYNDKMQNAYNIKIECAASAFSGAGSGVSELKNIKFPTHRVPDACVGEPQINRRNFGSKYEVRSYLGISMKVMVQEDMFAHKLVAMFERIGKTNRDIFDVWFFLKNNWPINEKIVEKRTGISMKIFLQKCIDMLTSLSDRGILSGMGELLDAKQKTWGKEKLRAETIFLLTIKLDSLKK